MPRQQLIISERAHEQLRALAENHGGLNGGLSRAAEVAIARLWHAEFEPASDAPDVVLERTRAHLCQALAVVEGELERREGQRDA